MRIQLTQLNLKDLVFFFLVMLQYLMCSISGYKVSGHLMSCVVIVLLLVGGLCYKKIQIGKMELNVLIALILPFVILGIVQCLYYANPEMIIRSAGVFFNVMAAYTISKYIGFSKFAMMLRFLVLINVILVFTTVILGNVTIDLSAKSMFSSGVFISWSVFRFPVFLGAWDIGIDTFRCGGLFGHPNGFGLMSAIGIIGLSYTKSNFKKKVFWWLIFSLSFFVSESRASVLLVVTFYLLKTIISGSFTYRKMFFNTLFLSLSILLGISLLTLRSDQVGEVDVTSGRDELMGIVYSSWASGLDISKLIGIGIGNATDYLKILTGMNIPLDNSYIPLLLEMGIVGGTVWMLVLVGVFLYSLHLSGWKYSMPFLIGILVYSMVEHEFSLDIYSLHWLVYFLSCISNKNELI